MRILSEQDERLLRDLLDASAALWNEANYERLLRYNDDDIYEDEDVWDADTGRLEGKDKGVLEASASQRAHRPDVAHTNRGRPRWSGNCLRRRWLL